ncbi:MAG: hypothetical protein MZW92_76460 [Comamonadaceae bacterium]|nr:hypothetical protein [Comamonadaceae bacterium]
MTFTPPTGHMGVGNVMHSLNVAGRVLGARRHRRADARAAGRGADGRDHHPCRRHDGGACRRAADARRRHGLGPGSPKEIGVKHSTGHGPSSAPFIPAQQVKFIAKDDDRRRARALVADDKGGAAARTADVLVTTAGAELRRPIATTPRRWSGRRQSRTGRGTSGDPTRWTRS